MEVPGFVGPKVYTIWGQNTNTQFDMNVNINLECEKKSQQITGALEIHVSSL